MTHEVKARAIQVRAALEASGLDHGPISVHVKMHAMGLDVVPPIASPARIFRESGVARLEPKSPGRRGAGSSTPPRTQPPADLPADTRVRI